MLCRLEHPPQVLLGLADVLANYASEIDAIEVECEVGGEDLRGHGFAGAAGACEQGRDAAAARQLRAETPALIDPSALAHLPGQLAQLRTHVVRQDDVVPAVARRQSTSEL